jgi:hypothetical protein
MVLRFLGVGLHALQITMKQIEQNIPLGLQIHQKL